MSLDQTYRTAASHAKPASSKWRCACVVAVALSIAFGLASSASGRQASVRYVAFGDSVTEGTGDSPRPDGRAGYPPRLEQLVANSVVINEGLGGERTTEGLTRIDSVLRAGGDVLLLMEGTNDVNAELGPETTAFNLAQMARKAENSGFDVIQATVIPRWPEAARDSDNILTRQTNQSVRNIAGINGRQLVDVNETFLNLDRLFALYYDDRRGDAVGHPSAQGYDVIAQAFADVILGNDTINPAPGLITPLYYDRQVGRSTRISVELWDFGSGVNPSSVQLLVNGVLSPGPPVSSGNRTTIFHTPASPYPAGVVTVDVRASDNDTPPKELDREVIRFFTTQIEFPRGDINRDGRVDGKDLFLLARAFGTSPSSRAWDEDADFDQDGDIDGTDLAVVADNFGTSL